jgi:hypothetical protein
MNTFFFIKKATALTMAFYIFLLPVKGFSQDESEYKEASPESQAYHQYRIKTTTPPYGLEKIKALLASTKAGDDDDLALASKEYTALSFRQRFTYTMIHAESFSQNCDAVPPVQDEHKKISGFLPDAFEEYSWSQRQQDFLIGNRDSVMALIKESATRSKRIGLNYKQAVLEINGWELIPFMVEVYNRDHKDLDILTLFMLMMKENKYAPFLASPSFTKLYGIKSNSQSFIQFNKANEDLIIKRALDFYKGSH